MHPSILNQLSPYDFKVSSLDRVHLLKSHDAFLITEGILELRDGRYDIQRIGAFSYMGGRNTFMRHIASIGRFCSIASNIIMGETEHPTDYISSSYIFHGIGSKAVWNNFSKIDEFQERNSQYLKEAISKYKIQQTQCKGRRIVIGHDVWIGEGVFISRGVKIGHGAIIAARSVVTKDVPPYAIVGGIPARVIRYRFDDNVIEKLLSLRWWAYGLNALDGVYFHDIHKAIRKIQENIQQGASIFAPQNFRINPNDNTVTAVDMDILFLTDNQPLDVFVNENNCIQQFDYNDEQERKVYQNLICKKI